MEKYTFRKTISAAALAAVGALTLSGCGAPNYEGTGNEFTIRGVVHDIDDGVIKVNQDQVNVIDAKGQAEDWFTSGQGQDWWSDEYNLHASYNKEGEGMFDSCDEDHVLVGKVYDVEGHQMPQAELEVGNVVDVTGRIRETSFTDGDYCSTEERAVYDSVTVTNDPLDR